jgi:carbon storage regulator
MLYLTRKVGESIIIDNNIVVTVVQNSKNIVKLGFTYPNSTSILRKEIHDKIAQENISATNSKNNNDHGGVVFNRRSQVDWKDVPSRTEGSRSFC